MNCPNITSPDWLALENKVGREKALYLYNLYGEDIPSLDEVDNLLSMSEDEIKDKKLKDSIGLIGDLTARKQNDLITSIAQSIDLAIKSKQNSVEDVFKAWHTTISNLDFKDKEGILKDWLKVKKATLAKLSRISNLKIKDGIEVEGYEDVDSILDKKNWNDEGSLQIDPKDGISGKLRSVFSFLSTGERGYLGQPRYVESDVIMNTVSAITSDLDPDLTQIIAALNEHSEAYPWISQLINELNKQPSEIKNQFVVFATKHYGASKTVLISENEDKSINLKVIDTHQNSLIRTIQSSWVENIKDSSIVKEDLEGNLILDKEGRLELVEEFKQLSLNPSIEGLDNWLRKIGVELSSKTLNYIKENSSLSKDFNNLSFEKLFTAKNSPLAYMIDRLKGNEKDTSKETIELNNPLLDNSGVRALAKLEAQYTENYYSSSWKNGENNTVFAYTINKYFTQKFRKLKTNPKLLDDLSKISFSRYSTWLNKLKTSQTFKDGFNYFYVDTIKKQQKGKKGKKLKDQSNREHEVTKVALFQNSNNSLANFLYLTMSNKTTMLGVSAERFEWGQDSNGLLYKSAIDELFNNTIKPEYQRILQFQKNKAEGKNLNIDGYNEGANKFIMMPSLNTDESLDIWAEDTLIDLSDDVQIRLKDYLQKVVNTLTINKIEEWKKLGVINETGTKANYFDKNYEKALEDKVNGDSKLAIEYAAKDYVLNYLMANSNFFMLLAGDPAQFWKTDIATTMVNIGKRLAKEIAPGVDIPDANKEMYKQVFLSDRKKVTSNRIDYLEKLLGVEGAKAYKDITATDAQEFTTLQEHIHLMNKLGQLSDKDYNSILTKYDKGQELDLRELSIVLQPMKPVYVESIVDIDNDINRTIYIKSSSFPLIKQLTEGLEIDKLRQAMENPKATIQRACFKSAVKVGGNKFVNIWNEDGTIKDNLDLSNSFTVLPRTGFRIQQEVPFDEDKAAGVKGTQETILLVSNLLDNPEIKALSEEYNTLHNELYYDAYTKTLEELTNNGQLDINKLRNTLVAEAESRNWNVNDIVALQSVKTNAEDKFEFPLWATISADKIESLLNSLIDNKIRKQKMPGFSGVLATEEGFIGKAVKSSIVFLEGYDPEKGLQSMREENGKIKPAQIFAPCKLRDNNGKLINVKDITIEKDGKKYIDTTKISLDLLKAFGYRIPTQGHNSMSYMEIVGFLPYEMGDLLIVPKDFTIQMGSDFDIDKLYVYQYHSEMKDGKLVKYEGGGKKGIQNKILDIHFKVLSNSNKKIQEQIHQALDTPILEDLVKKWYGGAKKYITLLSDEYQKKKYIDATAGKMGVGVFSLDSVFNTIIQDKDIDLAEEKPIIFAEASGNKLSDPNTVNGRPKSSVISNFQSAAVDDEAKQVLEKLNINRYTFDAIRALNQSGFEEEHTIALITQPIIKEYVDMMKTASDSLSTEFNKDARETIVQKLIEKYNKESFKDIHEDRALSITELKEQQENYEIQLAVLNKFNKASRIGEKIQTVQTTINTYSKGLGKNLFESFDKEGKVQALTGNTYFTNISSLLGEYTDTTLSKPTTINGFATFYALLTNNRLWSKLFPYQSAVVKNTFKQIESITGNQLSSESKRDVWLEMKAYLYTKIMNKDVLSERERLFTNKALVERTKAFSKTLKGKHNPFINRLKYGNDFIPEYNSAAGENKDELDVYHGLTQMLTDPEPEVKKLAQDLILASLLTGGIQEARQYYKYIPNQYLINIGFIDRLSKLDFNNEQLLGDTFSNTNYWEVSQFVKQYIQNNPKQAEYVTDLAGLKHNPKDKTIIIVDFEKAEHIREAGKDKENPELRLPIEFINVPKKGLFQYQGNSVYKWIPTLSQEFMLNYNGQQNKEALPILIKPNKDIVKAEPKKYTNPVDVSSSNLFSLAKLNLPIITKDSLANILNSSNKLHASIAEELLKNFDRLELGKIKLTISNEKFNGAYSNNTNTIYLSKHIDSKNQLEKTYLHELIHAALNKVLLNPITNEQKNIIASLETLRKKVLDKINSNPELKTRYNKLVKELKINKKNPNVSKEDLESLYGATELNEFVTNLMTEPKFQLFLNEIPFDGNRESTYQRFVNLVKKILDTVGFNITKDSVLEKGIEDVVNLINLTNTTETQTKKESINPEDDIPDGILSLLPKAKENKYAKVIRERENRLEVIEKNIAKEKDFNKKEKLIELRNKIEKEIEVFKEDSTLENIIEFIENDKQEIKEILSQPNLTDSELIYIDKIVHNLENYIDYMFTPEDLKPDDEGNLSPRVLQVQDLLKQVDSIRTELTQLQLSAIAETINKTSGSTLSIKDIISEFTNDMNVLQANTLNISRTGNKLAQTLYRIMLDQQNSTKDEVKKVADAIDEVDAELKKNSTFQRLGFKLFSQLDEDGKPTGRLVNYISDKFYKTKKELQDKAKKNKNWKEYFDFIKENEVNFDIRKLYNSAYIELGGSEYSTKEINDYKETLKSIVGENRFKEISKSLDNKVQLYLDKRESALNRYSTEKDETKRKSLIEIWEIENSPFYYSEYVEKGREYKKGEPIPKGYNFGYSIPVREKGGKDTGFYDKNFDIIQNDETLYKYYRTYVDNINQVSNYLPSNIKNKIPYNFIPSIKRSLAEDFSEKGYKGLFNTIWDETIDSITDYKKSEDLVLTAGVMDDLSAEEKSYDLTKALKVYAIRNTAYKYKSEISDTVDLFKHAVDNIIEKELDKEGANANYTHLKQAIDHKVKTFYGKGRNTQGLTDKLIENSKGEKKGFSFGKIGDRLIWWTQMKSLAWNPFSAITDGLLSTVNHLTHAAGEEDFTLNNYFSAKKIMLNTVGGGIYNKKMYDKIHKLIEHFGVEDNIYDTVNTSSFDKSKSSSMLNWFMPMEIRKRIEFQNRGTTFISMLLNDKNKVKDKDGNEITLFEAFDEEGNWRSELFDEETNLNWLGESNENKSKKDFQAKLNQVIALMHGDYNPESGLRIKEGVLGRMVSVFRTWIPEGVASRFENEKDDNLLGRKRKGRYKTFASFYSKDGYSSGNAVTDTMNLLKALLTKGGREGLSEVDAANMRKNFAELAVYVSIYASCLLVKGLDDEEKEEGAGTYFANFLMNQAFRIQTDITFYASPISIERLQRSAIPPLSTLADTEKFFEAVSKYIQGEDEIPTGVYAHESRLLRATAKLFPGGFAIYRNRDTLERQME